MPIASNKPPKPPKWHCSDAKKQLIKDIRDGRITGKPAKEVHEMRPECKQCKCGNFRDNLKRLRENMQLENKRAESDAAAFAHDEALNLRTNSKPHPRWQGSEADRRLKLDIDNEVHLEMPPRQLRATRSEFMEHPLDVLRSHIQQELRAHTEHPHWMAKKAEKEAKKAKKTKKKKGEKTPPEPVA